MFDLMTEIDMIVMINNLLNSISLSHRCCKGLWLAAYWCLYQSCSILSLWASNCSCIGFLAGLEGKGALDWGVVWRDAAVFDACGYYSSHELGETGIPLRFFFSFFVVFIFVLSPVLFVISQKKLY